MKGLLLKLEPLIWLLFGQGIMIGSMLMTGWLLVVCVLAPLGMIPPAALGFERAHALASHPIGRVVLLGILADDDRIELQVVQEVVKAGLMTRLAVTALEDPPVAP